MHDIETSGLGGIGELELDAGEADQEETLSGAASEADETELAGELLSLGGQGELEQFLGDLVKSAAQAAGRFIKSPPPALKNALVGIARQALPQLGSAVGGLFGGAGGAKLGSSIASQAGKAFGLELEGLSSEDREFEIARHYIRFASDAAKSYFGAGPAADPAKATQAALVQAARRHAPGLVSIVRGAGETGARTFVAGVAGAAGAQSGRWVRRGTKLILFGV